MTAPAVADRPSVCVVGAGPAGLAAAAMLAKAGARVVVLERTEVGASWTSRYDCLHLHTVRWLSGLPGYPIPRSSGRWPSRDGVVDYLRAYAARSALDVRASVDVDRIDREDERWVVRSAGGDVDADRVVVATGYSNIPFVPDWPGTFEGEIVHSTAYRNPEPFRGRRVLVVGSGNSGAEIAADVSSGGAAEVLLSVRTPPAIVRRDTAGIPTQLLGIASSHLPVSVADRVAATMRRIAFPDLAPLGLPAPERPYSEFLRRRVIPVIDVGIVDAIRSGRVRVVADVERLDGEAVVLVDGSRAAVDVLVAATGFRTGLEPLVGHLGVLDERGVPLVHGAEELAEAPGLHFVGYDVTLGGMLRVIGGQARRLAGVVAASSAQTSA
ncbi:NAD(P)/FAD-dependent oxidoreductase [Gaiella sp.]|uniref:flavin-containing monooxygenase n=1 Tax=Gaiella sp. TaxID=2663207 RepID=UPI002C9BF1F3|nr:NAD(P)/FAD-dependent oxidoreductase [Gaiella sp.]HWO81104.1 NAD(P)/FAD-dependent oxidoreductase [Gaiella sp.]